MFLPRKLQKRSNAGRAAAPIATKTAAEDPNDKVIKVVESPQKGQQSSLLHDSPSANRSDTLGASLSPPPKSCRTGVEAAKLDRLVDFLYMRLSPLNLTLSQTKHPPDGRDPGDAPQQAYSNTLPKTSSDQPFIESKSATIHLARLLTLLPGLDTRCKSVTLLSEALQTLATGAAANWFVVHEDTFVLEWLPPYIRFKDLISTSWSPSLISPQLAPLLVYAESIPPKIRTRAQAAAYVHNLMFARLTDQTGPGIVVGVFEPSTVDRYLMTGRNEPLPASVLEEKWTSGRGFFLLNSSDLVSSLCSEYPWHFSDRAVNEEKYDKTKLIGGTTEPIRCLSWGGWVEMREQYCKQQELIKEKAQTASSGQCEPEGKLDSTHANTVQDRRERKSTGEPSGGNQRGKWYRGTILLLSLHPTPSTSDALIVPPFNEASQVTPEFLHRYLKPQLEQRVPESISYIHSHRSASTDAAVVQAAIRTAHPHLANQLLTHFSELKSMDETDEDQYWFQMPDKPRISALNRLRRISAKLNTDTA
ncbi:hypothetical protein PHSY_001812 [Pseudozyma hubeiensis SY62]|uniref:Uncharacterized protein n=1 Tax=Pseudozyma hubeiensis (strain SY62) TaxID=1305764 RepID=R9NZM1_PSEHS|nr:hypothetical protein PHSY_001812 [Pseudozyma hubeiensis SY62]GAC94241.1 hypothetical protein PHSY_001812 [Pseudozyma hubeiensis SY62]